MSFKEQKACLRIEAGEEEREADEQESRISLRFAKWKRGTIWLGIALAASIVAVIPFSKGESLYRYSGSVGKFLVYLSMCLLAAFMYAAGITYTFWKYLSDTKKTNRKFAPPGSKYRTGKSSRSV